MNFRIWSCVSAVLFLPISRVATPLVEHRNLLFGDVTGFECHFEYCLVVGECEEAYVGIVECPLGYRESVCVAGNHADYFATALADGLNGFERAATSGDEVFDDYYFRAWLEFTLDEVLESVILWFAANIYERFVEEVSYECSLWDGSCSNTCYDIDLGEVFEEETCEFGLYECTQFGERECLTVVAIEGRFPTACPCERVFGLQLDGFDFKQFGCEYFFERIHVSSLRFTVYGLQFLYFICHLFEVVGLEDYLVSLIDYEVEGKIFDREVADHG